VSHVAQSILSSVKKILGVSEDDTSFDLDIVLHINSAFSTLHQIGVGPDEAFMIEDATATWDDFISGDARYSQVKTYICLRVRTLFDPPQTSYLIESMDNQIAKLEWSLNVTREGDSWKDPFLPTTA
jgi:hypothetical protein